MTLDGKTITYAVFVAAVSDDLFVTQEFADFSGWTKAGELLQEAWQASDPSSAPSAPAAVPLIRN